MQRIRIVVAGALLLLTVVPASAAAHGERASSVVDDVYVEPASGVGFLSAAIASARRDLDLSMYELRDPALEGDLVRAAHRGVRVRVLLNAAYYGERENSDAARVLSGGGVHVTWAPRGQIFHAKYLVVDNRRVYLGTGNLVEYYYSSTRDFWVLDQNAGDVAAVERTFSGDVHAQSLATVTHGGLVWSPGATGALLSIIDGARRTLLVENEEMRDATIEDALAADARRGVRVDVVMVKSGRYLSELRDLARHGVRVWLVPSSPIYLHAKVICADCSSTDATLFVGSQNFSYSSLDDNRELGVITHSGVAVTTVTRAIASDISAATRLTP